MKMGHRFITLSQGRSFCPVVAVVWPVELSQEFLRWSLSARLPGSSNPASDDAALGHWTVRTKNRVLASCPSIVQHPDEETSIIGRRAMWGRDLGRTSPLFDEEAAALEW